MGTTEEDMAGAVLEVLKADDGQYLRPAGEEQDPFVAIQVIMKMMENMRRDEKTKPSLPVWGCLCGREGAILVEGSLEYIMTGAQRYELEKPECLACGGSGTIK